METAGFGWVGVGWRKRIDNFGRTILIRREGIGVFKKLVINQ